MEFRVVSGVFNQIEQVSSRITITKLLADLFKKATPSEAEMIAYLSLGDFNAVYVGTKFNFAQKSMLKLVASLLDQPVETISKRMKQYGDIGLVIEKSEWEPKQEKHLSISQVNKQLHQVLAITGTGSQQAKEKALLDLFVSLDKLSAKYVARAVLAKLRLGFSDMTLLDAFSWMQTGDKSLRKSLEQAYNISADIGLIVKKLKTEGVATLEDMLITPGVPIRPAAAERLASAAAIIKKIGTAAAQPKLDGFRIQVHRFTKDGKDVVRFFSRNLQDMSDMFPELKKAVLSLGQKPFIAEGEAIAYDVETGTFLPFQETLKRRRKHHIEAMAKDVPLKLYLFDLLYMDGKSLLESTHVQRRKALLALFGKKELEILAPLEEVTVKTAQELESYFTQNVSAGLEGLVIKKPDSIYQPGKRNFNWIKLKRQETGHLDDTIDCVILGYYAGHGKRATFGIGALLVGIYNEKNDQFETIAKIGTGLSDVAWKKQKKMCDEIAVAKKPRNVVCAKELVPDVWVTPEMVCLIRADEITLSPLHSAGATKEKAGFALRFPRIMGYRDDKSAREATTAKEIKQLYKIQFQGQGISGKRKKRKKKNPPSQKLRRAGGKVAGQKTIF